MLYVIATPIGNLKDITYRAVDVLLDCALILCEDTRKSKILLKHYKIDAPLISFYKFNEKSQQKKIIEKLQQNQNIALISDAGTPLLSDPGLSLIQECKEKNIPFTSLPGPCSLIDALVLSGFDPIPFQFHGFLPKKKNQKSKILKRLLFYRGTSVCFESPIRLLDTLTLIDKLDKQRVVTVGRELTKKFEEIKTDYAKQLISYYTSHPCKGEIVLIISPKKDFSPDLSADEIITLLQEYHGLSTKEAIKISAKITKKSKREIYNTRILHNSQ